MSEFDITNPKVESENNIMSLIPNWNECILLGWTENSSYIGDYEQKQIRKTDFLSKKKFS